MLNLKKPVLLLSLSVLATQVAWAENIKTLPPFPNDMTMLLDASDIDANGEVDSSLDDIVNLKGDIETWYNKSKLNGGRALDENNFFSDAIAGDTGKSPKRLDNRLNSKATVSFQVDESKVKGQNIYKGSGFEASSTKQIAADGNYTKFVLFKLNKQHTDNNLISSFSTALWTGQAAAADETGTIKAWHTGVSYLQDKNKTPVNIKDYHIASTRYAKGVAVTPALSNILRLDSKVVAKNNAVTPHESSSTSIASLDKGGFLDGEIAEAIIYNRALTDDEILEVEDYLKTKWGGFKENKITSFVVGSAKKEIGKSIKLTAKASSPLKNIIFSSLTPSICKIDKKTNVKLLAIGKCTVEAEEIGNATYRSSYRITEKEAKGTASVATVKTFDVVAVGTSSGGGGGGSTTPLWLMMLGFIALLRRKV